MPLYSERSRLGTGIAIAASTFALAAAPAETQQINPNINNRINIEALAKPIGRLVSASLGLSAKTLSLVPPERLGTRRHHKKHLTPAQIADREVSPQEFAAWSKVNVCEEGGDWHVRGPIYSGGLGISNENWIHFGGQFFAPTGADATPKEQIVIAERIQSNPPDQNGCSPNGW